MVVAIPAVRDGADGGSSITITETSPLTVGTLEELLESTTVSTSHTSECSCGPSSAARADGDR